MLDPSPFPQDPRDDESWVPHNLEAEQALLGALFLNNRAYEDVSEIISSAHFFDPLHSCVFDLIAEYVQANRVATPTAFRAEFENSGVVLGGMTVIQYLGALLARATTITGAKDYAMTVRELADRRSLIIIGEDLAREAREAGARDASRGIAEDAESKLFEVAEKTLGASGGVVSFGEAARIAVSRIENAKKRGGGLQGLSTGLSDLDDKLGGLQRSDLIILAARPSMGKTALVTNIAWSVARNKFISDDGEERSAPVGFFSLEMSAEQLASRLISSETEIAGHLLSRGKLDDTQMKRVSIKSLELSRTPLFIDDRGGISIAQLCARARRMKRKHDIQLLIVDYLQLLSGSRKERVQELTQITTGLKSLAKELGIPVIALSQLNRDLEKRTDKRPQLSDLRESGSIEQDADVVMFVYREEYYWTREHPKPDSKDPKDLDLEAWHISAKQHGLGIGEVIIGKQRHGPIGTVTLAFNGETTKFSNLAREASS